MAKVEVLCPNGRRVPVKVLPNTKILQILEEVCTKQGYSPASDYELKHGRRSLDVTLSVQFAALPNLAKLELVRMSKSRAESSVVIALQLADGRRVQGEFMPSTTLWSVLEHFDTSSEIGEKLTVSTSSCQHPICIYMNAETVGEYALREATLRSLGLTGGKAVIRHLFREVSDEIIAGIMHRVDTEKTRQNRLQSANSTNDNDSPMASTSQHQPSAFQDEPPVSSSSSTTFEPMMTDDIDSRVTEGWNANQFSSIFQQPAYHDAAANRSSVQVEPWQPSPAPFAEFKFPEETKGQNVYKNELSDGNRQDFKPCDRETVVYSLDEIQPESRPAEEEIPDEFFEVTEADIRKMWEDLHRQTNEMLDQPLMTQSLRSQHLEAKMSRYKRVVIRIQFPDRLVIQGLFRTNETVFALYKFVKEHLQERDIDFELYSTPPKMVLKDMCQNLVEANLAPMSLIYFSSPIKKANYFSDAVLCEISSQQAANQVLVTLMPESSSATNLASASTGGSTASSRPYSVPSSSSSSGSGQMPKWFKTGK